MQIEYQLTEADVITLARYRLYYSPGRRNPVRFRQVAYAIGFTLLAIGAWVLSNNPVLPLLFLALALISSVLYPGFFDWLLVRRVKAAYSGEKLRATLAPRTVQVTAEGLEEKSALGETKVKWEAVDNIGVMPAFTVVSIQGIPSMIIPENRVTAGDYQGFVQACLQFSRQPAA